MANVDGGGGEGEVVLLVSDDEEIELSGDSNSADDVQVGGGGSNQNGDNEDVLEIDNSDPIDGYEEGNGDEEDEVSQDALRHGRRGMENGDEIELSGDSESSVQDDERITNGAEDADDDDDVMEVENSDPLDGYEGQSGDDLSHDAGGMEGGAAGGKHKLENGEDIDLGEVTDSDSKSSNTIVVNDTKSLVDLANSKNEPGKEPTLVIIDTNSIMAGRGGVPATKTGGTGQLQPKTRPSASIDIPDDAFLIEAPSFIVPYVFEQGGSKSLKETIKELANTVKQEREDKLAKGEELTDSDRLYEPKKYNHEDYFESPVGKLLSNIGMNLVQEFVQCDLLKMQKRVGEKEKAKSRMGMMTHLTQQSIISLKKNIEESKENNEPFRSRMKKCELCNFRTESELVMSTHKETPHMKNYSYRCNFCQYTTRGPQEIMFHMEAEHAVRARLERAPAFHQCPSCPFEDNSKAKLTRHLLGCVKRFVPSKNLEPPQDWDTPAKLPKLSKNRVTNQGINPAFLSPANQRGISGYNLSKQMQLQGQGLSIKANLPPLLQAAPNHKPIPGLIRANNPRLQSQVMNSAQRGMMMRGGQMQSHNLQLNNSNLLRQMGGSSQMRGVGRPSTQPSISITPLPRQGTSTSSSVSQQQKSAQGQGGKTSFVICEICDGYIKDLDQLRNHMQWIHKVKIHPKMIYNKPPLNCQKCQFRFFTDQGLERHLLGSHGLVTSSMQDAANKGQDSGRCPLCGKVYQWKLLAHVAKDHNVTLKPAHLSYKCTVCTATFGMYKLFESHVYSAHSVTKNGPRPERRSLPLQGQGKMGLQVTPRSMPTNAPQGNSFKPLKINDEITIIPQPMANSGLQRNKGSLTITPQPMRRSQPGRSNDNDEGIQIIEIDDAPHKNGRSNGEIRNRFQMSETLRKRNLEISLCDSENSDDSRGPAVKRIRQN